LARDIAVQYVARRYFAPKRVKGSQSVVKRKWNFRNPNLYLRPINLTPLLSPNMGERIKVRGHKGQLKGDIY